MWAKRLALLLLVIMLATYAVSCVPAATEAPPAAEAPEATEAPEAAEAELAEAEAMAETSTERAVQALAAMDLEPGTEFTIFSEDLTIKMAEANVDAFNEETGLVLKPMTAPLLEHRTKIMQDAMNQTGAYDIVILQWSFLGDLYKAGYLAPLTEWVDKYDPELDDVIAPFSTVWSEYAGEIYGLPTDGDTWILYYRRDLFEDPDEQAAFQAEYGYELAVPENWDQFNDVAEFFTRPDDNLYGYVEWRQKGFSYPWFYQRLAGLGGVYFEEGMVPGINSPKGVQALEDMKALNQYMTPDVLSYGYMETVQAFAQGHAAMLNTWPAAGKNIANTEESVVAGKVGYTTTPGYVLDGEVNKLTMTIPGFSLVVNQHSEKPLEAVYLVSQWLASPEQLKRANLNLAGNTDVVRESVFNDPEVRETIPGGGEYLDAQMANIAQGYPEFILPGAEEYNGILEIEISNYMTGETETAQEALDKVAAEWERITDKHGRESQEELYRSFIEAYNQAQAQ
jgi:multiple sugar transport system substrate-binding protein